MRKLTLAFFCCVLLSALFPRLAQAQGAPGPSNYPASIINQSGAPAVNCTATNVFWVNSATGDLYTCPVVGSAYVKAGNAGSGISGSGLTAGQPIIGNGTTNVVTSAAWIDVTVFSGADACAKINAAETAATTGITVNARGLQGTLPCALNPFPSGAVSNLLLGNAIFQVHQTWCTPSKILIDGIGWSKNPISSTGATVLQATSDLAIGGANPGPIIAWGNAGSCLTGQVIQDSRYTNITIDGAGIATTCVQAYNSQEYSGMEGFTILDCNGGGTNVGTSEMIMGAPAQIASDSSVSLANGSATITCTGCFADPGMVVNGQFTLATATVSCIASNPCTILSVQSANSATISATYTGTTVTTQQLTWAAASAQNSYFLHGNFGILNIAADCPQSGNAPGSMLVVNTGSGSNMAARVFDDMTFVNICSTGTPIPPVWNARINGTGFNGRAWHMETALLAGATGGVIIGLDAASTAISLDGVTCTNMTNATTCAQISNASANTKGISLRMIKNISPGPTDSVLDSVGGNTCTDSTVVQYLLDGSGNATYTCNTGTFTTGVQLSNGIAHSLSGTLVTTSDSGNITGTTPGAGTVIFSTGALFAPNQKYFFHCSGTTTQATAGAGIGIAIQITGNAPTQIEAHATVATAPTTTAAASSGNFSSTTVTAIYTGVAGTLTTQLPWTVDGSMEVGAAVPTHLNLAFFSANASDAVVVKRDSACTVW